ncbi:MAG: membrane protein insertase YidC [Gammaproteobacteria bacterium]|nr:membrane protein insertase YidC [Gammaproteobacteria bacterium]
MDNTRLFLWLGLVAMLWLNYSAWLADRAPAPVETPAATVEAPPSPAVPEEDDALPDIADDAAPPDAVAVEAEAPAEAPSDPIRVRTDVLDVWIAPEGGDLVRADLLDYPVEKHRPDEPVRLLDYTAADRWIFQTGLRGAGEGPEPNHLATFRADQTTYELAEGQDELVVRLEWAGGDGLSAYKTYTFRRGDYRIDLDMQLRNDSGMPWRGASYAQMLRAHHPPERSYMSVETYSFAGPVLYDGDQYEKLDVEDLRDEPVTQTLQGGWLAGIQHHFLAAAVPPPDQQVRYQATTRGDEYVLTAVGPVLTVEPGAGESFPYTLFVGPKLQEELEATADGLELTVDYGVLTILAQPLFWVLSHVHDLVGNWGWAIVIVTMLIKLAFYKLTQTSGRSMAKMRKLAPRMKALQERYKDDRQALSRAMMEMYRKEKVNPAAGCLPILVQMPFFFAFYWVLIESVEMRQAPFILWIDDLSSRDPFFVLPLLMGAAMFFQTRLNPAPPDPMQARIMQIMPIVFTAMFALFPAGLVLYWLTNTVLSILQQWRINKVVARES